MLLMLHVAETGVLCRRLEGTHLENGHWVAFFPGFQFKDDVAFLRGVSRLPHLIMTI